MGLRTLGSMDVSGFFDAQEAFHQRNLYSQQNRTLVHAVSFPMAQTAL